MTLDLRLGAAKGFQPVTYQLRLRRVRSRPRILFLEPRLSALCSLSLRACRSSSRSTFLIFFCSMASPFTLRVVGPAGAGSVVAGVVGYSVARHPLASEGTGPPSFIIINRHPTGHIRSAPMRGKDRLTIS
jgi:hypothetical protein